MLGVKKMPLRSVLLPWLLLRVMFPHYTQQCWDYRCVFLLALSLNLPLDTMKGIIQCSLCVIGLFYFHNSYFDSDHVPMIFMRRHQQNLDWDRSDQPLYSNDKRLRKWLLGLIISRPFQVLPMAFSGQWC